MQRTTFWLAALGGAILLGLGSPASAESIQQALASTYSSNPEINAQRAQTRSDDEDVPIARAAGRPTVSAFGNLTAIRQNTPFSAMSSRRQSLNGNVGVQINQNLFQGFRVRNAIRQSEAGVLASRETLRNTVQNVLLDAAQVYMDVVRDTRILEIRQRNVIFLQEQVRAASERFDVGETTRTDVAQTRASLASARADVSLAEANLATNRATYRQIVGREPKALSGGFPYGRLVPAQVAQAVSVGQNGHPVILASIHEADAQAFAIRQIEGQALPTLSIQGTLERNANFQSGVDDPNVASVTANLSVPLYQGGLVAAQTRQAKEQYGFRKIQIDLFRDQVRAAVVSAWAQVAAARDAIAAASEGVGAAEIALSGVQEEQQVGQRTTLDVLDQQQTLLSARETLVIAERDLVVASFALLSAMGRLTAEQLRLSTEAYDPVEHYDAVKDKWYGFRTPEGG